MIFVDCILENCIIYRGEEKKQESYYNKALDGKEFVSGKVLIIRNCHLINLQMEGEYDYFEFLPFYCNNVRIKENFIFRDGIIKVNCLVWGGMNLESYINKFIAGLVLTNENFKFIDKKNIHEWKEKLEKYFARREKCQQKAKNKKD